MRVNQLYEVIAHLVMARLNCIERGNTEWKLRHHERLEEIARKELPSGSGLDAGTQIDFEESTGERLVFRTAFHHMNDAGYYVRWTEHKVVVKASLLFGVRLRITGTNRNEIKDYIHEVFEQALRAEVSSPYGEPYVAPAERTPEANDPNATNS